MKSVLISVQPYWVFLIIAKAMRWNAREKTIEVRKNFPKDENWDKVAKIYCSRDKKSFNQIPKEYQPLMETFLGKVIGEFVCDAIISHCEMANADIAEQQGCIKREKLFEYANGKELYGWHISNLVIYDKPKELYEFKTLCTDFYDGKHCEECDYFIDGRGYEYDESDCGCDGLKPLKRPPQSWCYVESEGDTE